MESSPWRLLFTLNVVFLAMLVVSVPYVERGSATWVITQISAILVVAMLVVSVILIRLQWHPFE